FFCIYYVHHLDLHSFPTRRSSDLKDTCKKVLRFDENYLLIILTTILLFNQLTIVVVNERFIWILLAILYSGVRCYSKVNCCENRDRKSTRLNSSHVSISYAVFCLK